MQLGLAVVTGRSMEPTYREGDVLLVAHGLAPRIGSPHLVQLPDADDGPRPVAVKRVTGRQASPEGHSAWWVERDNPAEGVDSWLVGALPDDAMRARVLLPKTARAAAGLRRCRTFAAAFRRGIGTG